MKIEEFEFEENKADIAIQLYKQVKQCIFECEKRGFVFGGFDEFNLQEQLICTWQRIWKFVRVYRTPNLKIQCQVVVDSVARKQDGVPDNSFFKPILVMPRVVRIKIVRDSSHGGDTLVLLSAPIKEIK